MRHIRVLLFTAIGFTAIGALGAHPPPVVGAPSTRFPSAAAAAALPSSAGPRVAPVRDQQPDSLEILREVRRAQARFERRRRRLGDRTLGPSGYGCDEVLGRLCLRLGPSRDWWPEPEPLEVQEARRELLAELAAAFRAHPGDAWIAGQLVAYRVEAGESGPALREMERCAAPDPGWWCSAMRGYLLHRRGDFEGAESHFEAALAAMEPEMREAWLDPSELLPGGAPGEWKELADPERAWARARFWRLADPLFLVRGNDRWTEHLARHTLAAIRSDAENAYGLRWWNDLREALIRYGWEEGWERVDPALTSLSRPSSMVGHEHPESRSYLPPREALYEPVVTAPRDWSPTGRDRPEAGYAPPYANALLPVDEGLLVFPRGDSVIVAIPLALPPDTSYHAGHDHPPLPSGSAEGSPPWMPMGSDAVLSGLFAVRLVDGTVEDSGVAGAVGPTLVADHATEDVRTGPHTVPRVTLTADSYLISAEVWAADSLRAGRHRTGFAYEARAPDLADLSSLVVAAPEGPEPESLDELLDLATAPVAIPGDTVRIGWEISGLGWRAESLRYTLELRAPGGNILRRFGRFLGIGGDPPGVELSWSEPGPGRPGPFLRTARLIVPDGLEPGAYRLRLRVATEGRGEMATGRALVVERAPR